MEFLGQLIDFTIQYPVVVLGLIFVGFVLLGFEIHCRLTGGYDDDGEWH